MILELFVEAPNEKIPPVDAVVSLAEDGDPELANKLTDF